MKNCVIIITGVSGSGKTVVGMALAKHLMGFFYDGDSFHSASNLTKMSSGIPLDDDDRIPWLKSINRHIKDRLSVETLVVACSALKEKYRMLLGQDIDPSFVFWVHLHGSYELIYRRMSERVGHFMTPEMLRSQFATYEKPKNGIFLNVDQELNEIVNEIISKMEVNKSDVGLVGLGVMGTSLARNIASKGFTISVFNRHVDGKEEHVARQVVNKYKELNQAKPFDDLKEFVTSLRSPRKIILMVNAGSAVDDVVKRILPFLQAGDVIIEGGNSYYMDSGKRQKQLEEVGIQFIGTGVSGGEEGALVGPSLMPGGSKAGYELVKEILTSIAARNSNGEVCCEYIGDGGAGHFVKMVHNGIEYAEMQLIAEMYSHFRYDQNLEPEAIAKIFDEWNSGEAASYLLEIISDILRFKDHDGAPLIDKISDVAGNKGTGSWTTKTACDLGVSIPSMTEALFSRYLSSCHDDRLKYSKLYAIKNASILINRTDLLNTFLFCRILNHYQGFKLIKEASDNFQWNINTAALLRIWSGGCIIRSALLFNFSKGWLDCNGDIMQHSYSQNLINRHFPEIRETISKLAFSSRPYPVVTSCLDYFKGLTSSRSSAYMIQAQRDYFGAHTYNRTDDSSGLSYHTKWF